MNENKKARLELIKLVADETVRLCVNYGLSISELEDTMYKAISIAKKSTKTTAEVKCSCCRPASVN